MWARDERTAVSGRSFFERARRENLAALVASAGPASVEAGGAGPVSPAGSIDDDDHLAAYNAYLARLNRQHDSGG
jgi:hypothetical protein